MMLAASCSDTIAQLTFCSLLSVGHTNRQALTLWAYYCPIRFLVLKAYCFHSLLALFLAGFIVAY